MYLPDLSPYIYMNEEPDPNLLAVGWLDEEHDFPKGQVSADELARILALCLFRPVNPTRGFHVSPFFRPGEYSLFAERDGARRFLGSAEIRVHGKDGRIYAAPNLIYHYIKDCGYLPPQAFLDALNSMAAIDPSVPDDSANSTL